MTPPERRDLPEVHASDLPRPPVVFEDSAGDEVAIHRYGEGPLDEEFEALVGMYVDFSPEHRAQGIPPIGRDRVEDWLEMLLDGVDVVAWSADEPVGHATLVPADDDTYELAIFVHQDHQGRGIGGRLIRALLGAAHEAGVTRIWLTVERWNDAAVGLYQDVGFDYLDPGSFEMEMGLRLVD
jgi:hypothetical protein